MGFKCLLGHKGDYRLADEQSCRHDRVCVRCRKVDSKTIHAYGSPQQSEVSLCLDEYECRRCGDTKAVWTHEWESYEPHQFECKEKVRCSVCGSVEERSTPHEDSWLPLFDYDGDSPEALEYNAVVRANRQRASNLMDDIQRFCEDSPLRHRLGRIMPELDDFRQVEGHECIRVRACAKCLDQFLMPKPRIVLDHDDTHWVSDDDGEERLACKVCRLYVES